MDSVEKRRDPEVTHLIDEVLGEEEQEKKRRKTGKTVTFQEPAGEEGKDGAQVCAKPLLS